MAERCWDDEGSAGRSTLGGPRRVVTLRTTSRPQPARVAAEPAESSSGMFPFGTELPFEPDAEAAAFLNAPRRPLAFHVAPFGTPPYGNPPSGGRSTFGGPLPETAATRGGTAWGPAYPAGA